MKKNYVCFLSVLLLIVIGCDKREKKDDGMLNFVYVSPAAATPYWVSVAEGINDAARELGVNVDLLGTDEVDQMRQIEVMETASLDRPDGLITMALNPVSFTAPVDYVVDNNVPVVLLDSDAPDSKRSFFIGVDTFQQGKDIADIIAEDLDGKAKIGIVTAGLDIEIINKRIDGIRDAIEKKYPNMEIISIEDAGGDTIVAGDKASAMLQTYPEINVMIAAGASDVPGIGKAIEELGLADKVIGIAFNDEPQGLDYLKSGVYDYILCNLPYELGYASLQAMYAIASGKFPKNSDDSTSVSFILVTKDNVDTYKNINPMTFEDIIEKIKK